MTKEEMRFEQEITDTGIYYYENDKRIHPEDFWSIIKKLEKEMEEEKIEVQKNMLNKDFIRFKLQRLLKFYSQKYDKMEFRDVCLIENIILRMSIVLGLDAEEDEL